MNKSTLLSPKSWQLLRSKQGQLLAVVLVFGIFGTYFLMSSNAATPASYVAEAEDNTVVSPATTVNESNASGGSAVKFMATGTGAQACLPYPSFPDANCTGPPAGTVLSAYAGPSSITTNNTVIDSKTSTGGLDIAASGVVIRNSVINGAVTIDDAANYARSANGTMPVVTILDSIIDCHGSQGATGVGEAHYTLIRVEIIRCENGLDMNQNIVLQDSFIHNLGDTGIDPHSDGAQCAGGAWNGSTYLNGAKNLTLRHNTMYGMSQNDTLFQTSAIICGSGTGGNITVDKNLLAGGAYTLYCSSNGAGVGFRVTDNHFSTKFKSTVGAYGPSDSCGDEIISGNVIHETGAPINFAGDY